MADASPPLSRRNGIIHSSTYSIRFLGFTVCRDLSAGFSTRRSISPAQLYRRFTPLTPIRRSRLVHPTSFAQLTHRPETGQTSSLSRLSTAHTSRARSSFFTSSQFEDYCTITITITLLDPDFAYNQTTLVLTRDAPRRDSVWSV